MASNFPLIWMLGDNKATKLTLGNNNLGRVTLVENNNKKYYTISGNFYLLESDDCITWHYLKDKNNNSIKIPYNIVYNYKLINLNNNLVVLCPFNNLGGASILRLNDSGEYSWQSFTIKSNYFYECYYVEKIDNKEVLYLYDNKRYINIYDGETFTYKSCIDMNNYSYSPIIKLNNMYYVCHNNQSGLPQLTRGTELDNINLSFRGDISRKATSYYSMCKANNEILCVSRTNKIILKTDGNILSSYESNLSNRTYTGLVYGNNTYVLVNYGFLFNYSYNGIEWYESNQQDYKGNYYFVDFYNNLFIAGGGNYSTLYSEDGKVWIPCKDTSGNIIKNYSNIISLKS